MGTISSSVGLISGINTGDLIDQLLAIEARPKQLVQNRNTILNSQSTALQDINARLLALKSSISNLTASSIYKTTSASSSNNEILNVTSSNTSTPGSYNFSVSRLVSTQQSITKGFTDQAATTVGAGSLTFEFGDAKLESDTELSRLNGGAGVTRGKIRITDRTGNSAIVDLSSALTVKDVLQAINDVGGININASVSGDALKITDNTGATTTALSIANVGTTNTASSLGLTTDTDGLDTTVTGAQINTLSTDSLLTTLNDGNGVRTVAGNDLTFTAGASVFNIDISTAATLGDVIDTINNAGGNTFVTAGINSSATGLSLTYAGPDPLDVTGASSADLGIAVTGATSDVTGSRLIANLNSKLIKNLNGGSGASLGTVTITPRSGAGNQFNVDLSSATSINDVIDLINNDAGNTGNVLASLNNARNGLLLTDKTGATASNFIVTGTGASDLGIDQSVADAAINSNNLQFRYLSESTRLDALSGGQGFSRGQFIITDSRGISSTVDLSQGNEVTIQDVLDEINSRGLTITASVNANGDGILIQDTGPGTFKLKVAENGANTARDLGILGEAATEGDDLDGSFEKTVIIEATDTLTDVSTKINSAGYKVQATIINDGSSSSPYRLSFNALNAGRSGAFLFDDGGLNFKTSELVEAKNAVVFFGSADPATAVPIQSSSNSLNSVIPGATIDLKNTNSSPVEVVISKDDSALTAAVQAFVDNFNSVISTLSKYDSYDAETKQRGLLLGDPTVAQVRNSLFRVVNSRNTTLVSQFNALVQIGVKVGEGSALTFDTSKLNTALLNDRSAVEQLFTFKDITTDSDGIVSITSSGIGVTLEESVKNLTDSISGTLTLRTNSITKQIELGNERIENLDALLANKKLRLQAQFNAMEQTLALLQQQSTALSNFQPISFTN